MSSASYFGDALSKPVYRRRFLLSLPPWWWWMARVLSAAQHVPGRHFSPSVGVIRAPATIRQAGRFNPSFTAPPEPPRARPAKPGRGSTPKPVWVGFGHLARQLASRAQKPFLLRSLAKYQAGGAQARRYRVLLRQSIHTHARNGGKPGGASSTNGTISPSRCGLWRIV